MDSMSTGHICHRIETLYEDIEYYILAGHHKDGDIVLSVLDRINDYREEYKHRTNKEYIRKVISK